MSVQKDQHDYKTPGDKQSRGLPVKYGMTNIKGSVCAKDVLLREHCIAQNCKQNKKARACIFDWAEVILELSDSRRKMQAEQIVFLLHAKDFEPKRGVVDTKGRSCIYPICTRDEQ